MGVRVNEDGSFGSYRDEYGCTKWDRLIDSDWSSKFGIYGYKQSKDGFWARDRKDHYEENFRQVMFLFNFTSVFETSSGCFRGACLCGDHTVVIHYILAMDQ